MATRHLPPFQRHVFCLFLKTRAAYPRRAGKALAITPAGTTRHALQVGNVNIFLEPTTVTLALQFEEFSRTGHKHLSILGQQIREIIEYLIRRHPRQAEEHRSRRSSIDTDILGDRRGRSIPLDQPEYPPSWAIDKPSFRRSVLRFEGATRQLRALALPPSTGCTPIPSPAPTPSSTPPAAIRRSFHLPLHHPTFEYPTYGSTLATRR